MLKVNKRDPQNLSHVTHPLSAFIFSSHGVDYLTVAKASIKYKMDLRRALEEERLQLEKLLQEKKMMMQERIHHRHMELNQAMESKLNKQQEMLERGFNDREIEQLKERKKEADPGFFTKYVMPAFHRGGAALSWSR